MNRILLEGPFLKQLVMKNMDMTAIFRWSIKIGTRGAEEYEDEEDEEKEKEEKEEEKEEEDDDEHEER